MWARRKRARLSSRAAASGPACGGARSDVRTRSRRFTLAEAAKRVGVTGAAPYRHFADRNALVAALAQQGFEHFNEQLGRAWDGGRPDPVMALRRRGAAYLAFAKAEPGLYKAMFGDAGFLAQPVASGPAQKAFDDL